MLSYALSVLHGQNNNPTPFERLLRRDRTIVSIALLILIVLAWLYVVRLATSVDMVGMDANGLGWDQHSDDIETPALECCRVRLHVPHVGGHDGRHDAAVS